MNNDLKAIIMHLSDMHFNRTFQNEKPTFLSRLGAAPHDFKLLRALDTVFSEIPFQIQKSLGLERKPKINMIIITGDLTTDSEKNSFGNAQTFLKSKYVIGKNKRIGVNMSSNLFLVPGNHDCLFQKFEKIAFLRYFFTKYYINYSDQFDSLPYFKRRKIDDTNFLLIGIDTNRIKKRPRNIARGKVGSEQIQEIDNFLTNLRERNEEYFNSCFKIAFFHHHLLCSNGNHLHFLKNIFKIILKDILVPHTLKDASNVIKILCRHKIDMAIFGHEHKCYRRFYSGDYGNIIASCAGSAVQLNKKLKNSFNLYLIFSKKIQLIEYKIKKESFCFEPKMPLPPPFPLPNPR